MRTKRIVCIICVIGMVIFSFAGCGTKSVQLKWTQTHVRPRGKGDGSPVPTVLFFESTVFERVQYCFEKEKFEEESSKDFIRRESKLLNYADKVLGNKRDGKTVYINGKVNGKTIRIWDGVTYDSLWMALNSVHKLGGLEQYGLFYLYCKDNQLFDVEEKAEITEEAMGQFFSKKENMFLLDFCVPMIDPKIFSEEQVAMTKAAAKSFAAWYVKEYSLEEYEALCESLENYDKKKLENEKNKWLKSISGTETYAEFSKDYLKPTNYVYTDQKIGSDPGDYEIERPDVIWILYDKDIKRIGYKKMIKKYNAVELIRAKDFADAREFLKDYLPKKIGKAKIFLDFHSNVGATGLTQWGTMNIKLNYSWNYGLHSLLHEYIHYLTMKKGGVLRGNSHKPSYEGMACWVAYFRLKNRMYDSIRSWLVEKEDGLDPNSLKVGQNYIACKGMLYSVQGEFSRDPNRKAPKGVPFAVDPNLYDYSEYATITEYVYQTYGMEKTIELLKSEGDYEKVLGKSLDYIYFEAVDYARKVTKQMEAEDKKKNAN
ncbi:MAG: hypothetical protein E7277_05275 [Lachnospiraceae bacterium]|nr:hypothetical protein [Lachnospiraceae bacterium]